MSTVITQAGYEVWFQCGRAAYPAPLLDGLKDISNEPPYVPESRTKLESLQLALSDFARANAKGNLGLVVRPLANRAGRHVWKEIKNEDKNDLTSAFTVKVPDGDRLIPEGDYPPTPEALDRIQDDYDVYMTTLGAKAVKTILVKEIQRLGGVRIDGKDAYFLPPESIDQWNLVVDVVRSVTVHHDAKFYEQKYELNGSALEAVQVAVEDEVTTAVDSILEELSHGQFTDRVANNRLDKLAALSEKMKRYENLFNAGLQACNYKMNEVINAMSQSIAAADDDVFDTAV